MRGGRLPRLMLIACALAFAGCASDATRDLISANVTAVPATQIAAEHQIFVATTRAKSERVEEIFDGRRSPTTSYAKVDITVPAIHKTGEIERRKKNQPADPSKFMVAQSVTAYDEAAFSKALRADIAKHGGRALVFVHGYNTAFDGAVYRMTQIVNDSDYSGTPVLFTWASGGRTLDYVYDNNSASAARDALEATLRLVAKSGAKRVDIIAHSMGNWVTMEALRQLAISGDRDLGNKLGDVVLASPDIDVDVFKSQMARYGVPDKPFILFLSGDDRALRISGLIAGKQPRVGDYGNAADLAKLGVVAVDLSKVKSGDRLNHTKFAENPVLIKILGERLKQNSSLVSNQEEADQRLASLTGGITGTLASAAEVIITTPLNVVRIAVGQ
ncbi:alpha/beta hydrolase [Mesorhizobium sp. ASY16-5R]|uniref:alpha/beta hydrolase n=1 Tax=Mesorhizobium sp. ASY16-5R TaxID=3445772 RepID=UPI003F9F79B5